MLGKGGVSDSVSELTEGGEGRVKCSAQVLGGPAAAQREEAWEVCRGGRGAQFGTD